MDLKIYQRNKKTMDTTIYTIFMKKIDSKYRIFIQNIIENYFILYSQVFFVFFFEAFLSRQKFTCPEKRG